MELIAINGFKGSGKDTLHACIAKVYAAYTGSDGGDPSKRVEQRAIGDNVKIAAARSLGYLGNGDELVALMDEFKDTGLVYACMDGRQPPGYSSFPEEGARQVSVSGSRYFAETVAHAQMLLGAEHGVNFSALAAKLLGCVGDEGERTALMHMLMRNGVVLSTTRADLWTPETGRPGDRGFVVRTPGRKYLQDWGYDTRLLFGEDCWVDLVCPLHPDALGVVWGTRGRPTPGKENLGLPAIGGLPGIRFANEAARVKRITFGGVRPTVVEITRPGKTSDGHESEQPLPRHLVDEVIVNDGTLDDLEGKAEELLLRRGVIS